MRETKFRYFYKEKWFYISTIKDNLRLAFEHYENHKTSQLYQFIGTFDKEKKEIYEGHLLEIEAIADYGNPENPNEIHRTYTGIARITPSMGACVKVIRYEDHMAEKEEDEIIKPNNLYKNIVSYRSKIIGNIHENPEILKNED